MNEQNNVTWRDIITERREEIANKIIEMIVAHTCTSPFCGAALVIYSNGALCAEFNLGDYIRRKPYPSESFVQIYYVSTCGRSDKLSSIIYDLDYDNIIMNRAHDDLARRLIKHEKDACDVPFPYISHELYSEIVDELVKSATEYLDSIDINKIVDDIIEADYSQDPPPKFIY